MVGPSPDAVQLITGLLGHMRQIVGEGACYAMLHYGATEEGKRFGEGAAPQDLQKMLARFDELLQQRTEILEDDGERIRLRVHPSPLMDADQRPAQGIVLGLVEGALTTSRGARYKGAIVPSQGALLVQLDRCR